MVYYADEIYPTSLYMYVLLSLIVQIVMQWTMIQVLRMTAWE